MIAHLHSPIHLISIESRTNVRASLGSLSERAKDKYDFEYESDDLSFTLV